MDKLMDYICTELEDLERKAGKEGKLSMAEVEYLDKLVHIKKNILKTETMWEESEYSEDGGSYASGSSYARGRGRGAKRDSMGRYSRGMSGEGGSSGRGGSYSGNSGASYASGGSYDGYSRDEAKEDLVMGLRELEQDADEDSKRMIKKWIKQLEQS